MSDVFKLSGSYSAEPEDDFSGSLSIECELDEVVSLTQKMSLQLSLNSDVPVSVPFGSLASACVIVVKAVGGKVKLTLTSADGTAQTIPVDSLFHVISIAVPYTAISVTRVPGTTTTVQVFLGESA